MGTVERRGRVPPAGSWRRSGVPEKSGRGAKLDNASVYGSGDCKFNSYRDRPFALLQRDVPTATALSIAATNICTTERATAAHELLTTTNMTTATTTMTADKDHNTNAQTFPITNPATATRPPTERTSNKTDPRAKMVPLPPAPSTSPTHRTP